MTNFNISSQRERLLGVHRELCDPIDYEVMEDPVMASDNFSYDRRSITRWFEACNSSGMPITSPVSGALLENDDLRPNQALKSLIAELRKALPLFKSEFNVSEADKAKIPRVWNDPEYRNFSSVVFEDMDKLSQMDLMKTLNLRPPQLVTIGAECENIIINHIIINKYEQHLFSYLLSIFLYVYFIYLVFSHGKKYCH